MTLVVRNIAIHSVALRFSPLGCGAAHVHHSASLHVVYSGTLCSSFLPVAFYAQRRLQYSDSVSPSSTHAVSFWMKAGLFCLCSDGETALVLSRWSYVEEDALLLAPSFFLSFFNKMWDVRSVRGFRGVLSSVAAAWLKRGFPAPFFIPYTPSGTRGVCMQKVVYRGKVRETVFLWLFPKFGYHLEQSRKEILCVARATCIGWFTEKEVLGYGDHTEHKIRCSVTGSLCSVFEFMGLQSKSKHEKMSTWCRFTCLSVHVYPYYFIWTVKLLQTIGIKQWGGVKGNKNCCIQYCSLFSAL